MPTNLVVCSCEDLVISPTITGPGPFTCVWRKDGTVIPGQTNVTLTVPMMTLQKAGSYTFEITGPCNSVTLTTEVTVLLVRSGRWDNTNSIVIPQIGAASPYPSSIFVQCAPKSISQLQVTLHGFSHEFPDDVDIMLVAPNGTAIVLMSDSGGIGANAVNNVELTFSQDATAFLPDNAKLVSGLYRPTNQANDIDPFQSPAPSGASTTNLSALYGTNPNGYWSLYVVDDHGEDSGSLKGWTLDFGNEDFVAHSVSLTTPEMLPSGAFQMQLHGTPGKTYYLEASASMTDWTIIQTNQLSTAFKTLIDYTAPQFNYRFYRASGCPD